ncbi:hypothetical protein IE991_31975 [Klebsiella pneumoniae]|uniref:Uncharacterized protein n=1 Tax=Klebsiella pneumoniae TaxID=573 RepID=A0A927HII1_KLEPN|nr:hypothetical protein [Klebsiella pneumoniae]
MADRWFIDNGLTNLTLFRHYLMHYLAERRILLKRCTLWRNAGHRRRAFA